MSRAEIDFVNSVQRRAVERRVMHWMVQRVDEILTSADSMPGISHADASAALIDLGVSFQRVRDLLAGNRRKTQCA